MIINSNKLIKYVSKNLISKIIFFASLSILLSATECSIDSIDPKTHEVALSLNIVEDNGNCASGKTDVKKKKHVPTAEEISENINARVRPPLPPCPNGDTGVQDSSSAAKGTSAKYPYLSPYDGARKVFATKFQSCDVLNNIYPETKESPIEQIERLYSEKQYPGSGCINAIGSSLMYERGGVFQSRGGVLDVSKNKSDCSNYISSALYAAGLKMSKNDTGEFLSARKTTVGIMDDLLLNKSSCFEDVNGDINNGFISRGDILNNYNNHVVMVDSVGHDPFSVKKIINKLKSNKISSNDALEECKRIQIEDLDFSIIHSSTIEDNKRNGIHRVHISIFDGDLKNIMVAHARKICEQTIRSPGTNYSFGKNRIGRSAILRHKGTKDPACVMKKMPLIKGEGCVKNCFRAK